MALAGVLVQPGALGSGSGSSSNAPSTPAAALSQGDPPHAAHPQHSQQLPRCTAALRASCSMASVQLARTTFDVPGAAEALMKDPRKILRALEGLAEVASDSGSVKATVRLASHVAELALSGAEEVGALSGRHARSRLATEIADVVASKVLQQIAVHQVDVLGQHEPCASALDDERGVEPRACGWRAPDAETLCKNGGVDATTCQLPFQGAARELSAAPDAQGSISAELPVHVEVPAVGPCASGTVADPAVATSQWSTDFGPDGGVPNTKRNDSRDMTGADYVAISSSAEAETAAAGALPGQLSQDTLKAVEGQPAAGKSFDLLQISCSIGRLSCSVYKPGLHGCR